MKLLYKFLLLSGIALLFLSCNDDEEETVRLKYPLAEMLVGHYWQEELRFVYVENGKTMVSEHDIFDDFAICGTHPHIDQVSLGIFRIDSVVWYSVLHYKNVGSVGLPDYRSYDNGLILGIDREHPIVRVKWGSADVIAMNAIWGTDMTVLEASEDRIVFDAPRIKSFVYDWWELKNYDGSAEWCPKRDYIGYRVTWTKFKYPELLDAATPLEEDKINGL